MPIKKIVRKSIGDQVFEQLKEQILNNEWQRGEKMPSENELASLFGVSRITVRQALQKLTALGLIETRPGEGSFISNAVPGTSMQPLIPVAYLSDNALMEVLEFRWLLEGNVAGLAAMKADGQSVAELEKAYAAMEQDKEDLESFSKADLHFHLLLARMTQNPLIVQTFHIIQDVLAGAFSRIVSKRGNTAGLHYHRLILEAVRAGNAGEAKRIMDEHMEDLLKTYRETSRE